MCVNTFSKNCPERIRLLFCTGKWLNGLVGLCLIPFVCCLLPLTPFSLSLVVFHELKLHGLEGTQTIAEEELWLKSDLKGREICTLTGYLITI